MNKKEKGGELLRINVKEVSVVDAPANKRKFLFFKGDLKKADANFSVECDGTLEGTKIIVNGKELEDLKSFYFSFYQPDADEELYIDPVSLMYTIISDAENGFQTSQTYNLAKAEGKRMDLGKLAAFIKGLTEKDLTEAQLKKIDKPTLDSLLILSQYEGQMPDDLAGAVGHFLKDVDSVPVVKPDKKPDDKPTSDLSDEKKKTLTTHLEAISALLTGEKVEDPSETDAVLTKLKDISERIGKLEKGEGEEPKPKPGEESEEIDTDTAKILLLLGGMADRLKVVEKSAGVEQGIVDQEGGGGAGQVKDNYTSVPL